MRPAPLEPARACLHPDVIPDAPMLWGLADRNLTRA